MIDKYSNQITTMMILVLALHFNNLLELILRKRNKMKTLKYTKRS